jgi:dTDP-4-amino-4,6-dideoxygalactose transaminase
MAGPDAVQAGREAGPRRLSRYRIRYADWAAAEYVAALRCLMSGRVAHGANPARLAECLSATYAPSTVYPVNYGHTAIHIALKLFRARRPDRTEVVVPAYICPSVVQAIEAAGLAVIPAGIGPDLNMTAPTLRAVLGANTLAVIAPHMFGCPANIGEFERICRAAGVFLIDDAAQVVGEASGGRVLGTFGDIGLISFAQSKAVVTGVRGSGGVLLVNNPEFDSDARAACQALPVPTGRVGAFVHFLWNYMWLRYTGNSGYYLARLGERLGVRSRTPSRAARISNLEAGIALAQLKRLASLRAGKIAAAEAYRAAVAGIDVVGFPQYAPGRYLSRVMLSVPASINVVALRRELERKGIETRLGYLNPVCPGQPDEPAVAAARRLIGLPFGASLQRGEINKICSILSTAVLSAQSDLHSEINNNETSKTTSQR